MQLSPARMLFALSCRIPLAAATNAELSGPTSVTIDNGGNVFVADYK